MRRYRGGEASWGGVREGIGTLIEGGLVVYPTDTLYGLGCSREKCLERLYRIKGRRSGFSFIFPDAESAISFLRDRGITLDEELVREFLPGPFTFVVGGYGIRVPECEIALSLARGAGLITATSANRRHSPPPMTAQEAYSELGDEVDLYVDGGTTRYRGPSTVVELEDGKVSISRNGVGDPWKSPKGRSIGELVE
jgi:L-threonylcarbamoyladenylate synthase